MTSSNIAVAASGWLARWRPVLPLFGAEAIAWTGFGALFPVLPLFYTQQGVDLATLGLVVAAWPAARLVGEPVFGWLADRVPRVPLMVAGLGLTAAFVALPLVVHGAAAFVALRALAGLSTSIYDPAARGLLMDATPADRQGEAFGLWGAMQMAGLLLGPAIGGIGAAVFGSVAFVFIFGGISAVLAALAVSAGVRDVPRREVGPGSQVGRGLPAAGLADFQRDFARDLPRLDLTEPRPVAGVGPAVAGDAVSPAVPDRLANRLLLAAVVANVGAYFGAGTYEVIWSLFLASMGAGVGFIGLTFMMFSLPVLLLGTWAGRLVDRRGSLLFITGGSCAIGICAVSYPLIPDPLWSLPILVVEGVAFAFLVPALYAVVSRGAPPGRSSTAQGLFGAAGTLGFVVASLITGVLAEVDLRYPFYLFGSVILATLVLALAIGRRDILAVEPRRAVGAIARGPASSL